MSENPTNSLNPSQTSSENLSEQADTVSDETLDIPNTGDDHRPTIDKANFDRVTPFMIQLGAAAHSYGASSTQISTYLHRLCKAAGIDAHHLITPTYIWHVYSYPGEVRQFGYLDKLGSSNFDLGKLAELSAVVDQVCNLEITLAAAFSEIKELAARPKNYNNWMLAFGYLIAGGAFAVILNASWTGAALGALMSIFLFVITLLATNSPWLADKLDFVSAFAIGVVTYLFCVLSSGIDPVSAALAGVVVIIPGYALTRSISELTDQKVLSGAERLIGGILSALKIVFGASIGMTIVIWIFGRSEAVLGVEHADYLLWISSAVLTFGLAIVFHVSPRDLIWVVLGGVIAYGGVRIGGEWGVWQGPFLGSLMLSLYAALFSFRSGRPAAIVKLTAIMVLVPGASAILGIQAVHNGGVSEGLHVEWNAFLTILAIIAGQIIANTMLETRVHR